MPIVVVWDNAEKNIIRFDVTGNWSWDDFDAAFATAAKMIDEVGHSVYFITDQGSFAKPPNGSFNHVKHIIESTDKSTILSVFVTKNMFARVIVQVFGRLFPLMGEKIRFVETMEEAHALVNRHKVESTTAAESTVR